LVFDFDDTWQELLAWCSHVVQESLSAQPLTVQRPVSAQIGAAKNASAPIQTPLPFRTSVRTKFAGVHVALFDGNIGTLASLHSRQKQQKTLGQSRHFVVATIGSFAVDGKIVNSEDAEHRGVVAQSFTGETYDFHALVGVASFAPIGCNRCISSSGMPDVTATSGTERMHNNKEEKEKEKEASAQSSHGIDDHGLSVSSPLPQYNLQGHLSLASIGFSHATSLYSNTQTHCDTRPPSSQETVFSVSRALAVVCPTPILTPWQMGVVDVGDEKREMESVAQRMGGVQDVQGGMFCEANSEGSGLQKTRQTTSALGLSVDSLQVCLRSRLPQQRCEEDKNDGAQKDVANHNGEWDEKDDVNRTQISPIKTEGRVENIRLRLLSYVTNRSQQKSQVGVGALPIPHFPCDLEPYLLFLNPTSVPDNAINQSRFEADSAMHAHCATHQAPFSVQARTVASMSSVMMSDTISSQADHAVPGLLLKAATLQAELTPEECAYLLDWVPACLPPMFDTIQRATSSTSSTSSVSQEPEHREHTERNRSNRGGISLSTMDIVVSLVLSRTATPLARCGVRVLSAAWQP
jgi:hypothetical protein